MRLLPLSIARATPAEEGCPQLLPQPELSHQAYFCLSVVLSMGRIVANPGTYIRLLHPGETGYQLVISPS